MFFSAKRLPASLTAGDPGCYSVDPGFFRPNFWINLLLKYAKSDGMGAIDAIIAATAIAEDVTLSTRNRKHFRKVEGLQLEVPEY